jgi:hypothetical protein
LVHDTGVLLYLFVDQVLIMAKKIVSQKMRKSRQFWKETVILQIIILGLLSYLFVRFSAYFPYEDVYQKHSLPPLSTRKPWGIFSQSSKGNNPDTIISKRLLYSPSGHAGVEAMIDALKEKYPQVVTEATADYDAMLDVYQTNLFDTWAYLKFDLTPEQLQADSFITDQNTPSTVAYGIFISPTVWDPNKLPVQNFSTTIYNEEASPGDLFWASGYMTLQNFVDVYLARTYDSVSADFTVRNTAASCCHLTFFPTQKFECTLAGVY